MFNHLFRFWFFPLFGMFFAAGADALAGAGGGTEGAVIDNAAGADQSADTGAELHYGDDDAQADSQQPANEQRQSQQQNQEEPEVQEFKHSVSRRLLGMTKKAPKLAEAFKENPELQGQFEAVFRREAAYRDFFPTVAEAKQMREIFPNGLADVTELQNAIKESEALDNDFYTKDRDGNYTGHQRIVENMFRDDRNAAVAFFRGLPKQWANLDRDSYNDVMGKIVGATFVNSGAIGLIEELAGAAKEAKQDGLAAGLNKLLGWASGYLKDKPQPTEEEQRLAKERQTFDRERQDRDAEDGKKFHASFSGESKKLQVSIIKAHPAVVKLLASKSVTEQKKNEIIEQVRSNIEKFLGKSPSFMNKLKPAYSKRDLQETLALQKSAWGQQWLLNRMVRTVFNKEIPQMVSNNRAAVQRRAGAVQQNNQARQSSEQNKGPQPPKQIAGRWYRDGGKGAPFTTAEVLRGEHMK